MMMPMRCRMLIFSIAGTLRKMPGRGFCCCPAKCRRNGVCNSLIFGRVWARLRADVFRFVEYKELEMRTIGREPPTLQFGAGKPDDRVPQY